jgi:hypothetical protein
MGFHLSRFSAINTIDMSRVNGFILLKKQGSFFRIFNSIVGIDGMLCFVKLYYSAGMPVSIAQQAKGCGYDQNSEYNHFIGFFSRGHSAGRG